MMGTLLLPRWVKQTYWRARDWRGVVNEVLPARIVVMREYHRNFGTVRFFVAPRTFSEMVCRRMLRDRDPRLKTTVEKIAARDYAAARIGVQHIIPALFVGDDPECIPFGRLPNSFVIKVSHGSGYNIIVRDKASVDRQGIQQRLRDWMARDYWAVWREWAYKGIPRRILIEELLLEDGKVPSDYKFFVFGGRVRMVQVDTDRFEEHKRNLFDEKWRPLAVTYTYPPAATIPARPSNLEEMVSIAEKLGLDFDFCRVDLYKVGGRVLFGEITHYPEAGRGQFQPVSFDRALGRVWAENAPIPEEYFAR